MNIPSSMRSSRSPQQVGPLAPTVAVVLVSVALLATPLPVAAQQGTIVQQALDAQGEGITVLKVWGDPYEMGYAQGFFLADVIVQGVTEVKALVGQTLYPVLRAGLGGVIWEPA